jgi:N-acyl-L-homoserine lactone synthetase
MSQLNPEITNEAVIPRVESSFFRDKPEARFAIGILAVDSSIIPGRQNEYEAYLQLRRRVYVEQTGFLSPEDIQPDGTERDMDDARSVAFAVVENRGIDQRLVATARLIRKDLGVPIGAEPRPLPVEREWPEVFINLPNEPKSAEVSRLISRHEKPAVQEINKRKLYAELLAYARFKGLVSAYAFVDEKLERDLNRLVPTRRLGEPRYVEQYHTFNVPIEIDMPRLAERIEAANPGSLEARQAKIGEIAYYGTLKHISEAA